MSFLLASLLGIAASGQAQDPVVWKWAPQATRCVLRQDLGRERFLEIGSSPGSEQAGIGFVNSAGTPREWKALSNAQLAFEPGETVSVEAFVSSARSSSDRNITARLKSSDLQRFAGASAVSLSHADLGVVRTPVRSLAAAIDAIRACEDGKMKQWGVDAAAWRALSVKPVPKSPPVKWFSWLDYPDREKIYKNDITVVARLDVAADGSVRECTVVNRPPVEFVEAACRALKRSAEFEPARDADGNGTPSSYIFQVSFAAFPI